MSKKMPAGPCLSKELEKSEETARKKGKKPFNLIAFLRSVVVIVGMIGRVLKIFDKIHDWVSDWF